METFATLAVIVLLISGISALFAWIMAPKGISDDVMKQAHGDVPRMDWE